MTTAFVFPGQGSQSVGMGKEVYENFAVARETFEEVNDALGEKLSTLVFEGPIETLSLTENTQPALMVTSLAILRVLEKESGKNIAQLCSYVAGHSLGEYSALAAAGALSLADTARLLRLRGRAMQEAVPAGKGGMAALLGVEYDIAAEIAAQASHGADSCQAANDNGGGQVVLSGTNGAIDRAITIAADKGVKRAIKLPVSAPFHSTLMQPAADKMRDALADTTIKAPSIPLIANVTAEETRDPEAIRRLLVEQVTGMVRWRESVITLHSKGVTNIVEIGAGKVLSGLVKRIEKEMNSVSLQTPADIDAFLQGL